MKTLKLWEVKGERTRKSERRMDSREEVLCGRGQKKLGPEKTVTSKTKEAHKARDIHVIIVGP